MERIISDTEAAEHFAELIRDVAGGEIVTVTSQGNAIVRLVPVAPTGLPGAVAKVIEEWSKRPTVVAGPWRREDLYD